MGMKINKMLTNNDDDNENRNDTNGNINSVSEADKKRKSQLLRIREVVSREVGLVGRGALPGGGA